MPIFQGAPRTANCKARAAERNLYGATQPCVLLEVERGIVASRPPLPKAEGLQSQWFPPTRLVLITRWCTSVCTRWCTSLSPHPAIATCRCPRHTHRCKPSGTPAPAGSHRHLPQGMGLQIGLGRARARGLSPERALWPGSCGTGCHQLQCEAIWQFCAHDDGGEGLHVFKCVPRMYATDGIQIAPTKVRGSRCRLVRPDPASTQATSAAVGRRRACSCKVNESDAVGGMRRNKMWSYSPTSHTRT